MKEILVIQEEDTIIGVASTKEKALELILEYFGNDSEIRDIKDVRDSGIEFTCLIITKDSKWYYDVTVHYFTINEI